MKIRRTWVACFAGTLAMGGWNMLRDSNPLWVAMLLAALALLAWADRPEKVVVAVAGATPSPPITPLREALHEACETLDGVLTRDADYREEKQNDRETLGRLRRILEETGEGPWH